MLVQINWKEILGWTDDHIEEMRVIGYSYLRQGKYDIALPFFEALTALDRDNLYDLQTLGALYVQMNQPLKAERYLNRALLHEEDHGPTLLNLMKSYFMSKKIEEGLRLANILKKDENPMIAGIAEAFILSYSKEIPPPTKKSS